MSGIAELSIPIPEELTDEFVKRLAYVSEDIDSVRLLPGSMRVAFELRRGAENQASIVALRISEVASKLCENYRPVTSRTHVKRDALPTLYQGDPHVSLTDQGEIVSFGRGRYGFGPKILFLMDYFDLQVRQMAAKFEAEPRGFPTLIGADVLDRCRYLKNFPSALNFVLHLREDHDVLREFAGSARWDGERLVYDPRGASSVECLLSPSICFHWYSWLRDSQLPKPQAITAIGKCFRYESSNLQGLERLWDFSMREIVLAGPAHDILTKRDRLVELSSEFLGGLGMAYEITTAVDPFFVESYAVQSAYQQGFELKLELLAPLPYRGKKLAVGSINYHQDFFGRSFAIETSEGPAHTACLGFGYERLALAFLAQYGPDEQDWPTAVVEGSRKISASRYGI